MEGIEVELLLKEHVTHDIKRFVFSKPEGYSFVPGQATLVSINKPGFSGRKNPFTFTSMNMDKVLEFTVKEYPEHGGATRELHGLVPGDRIIIREPFGTINYKGKGHFIAAGAGITPFIAIFKQLMADGELEGNRLIFSNKTGKDVIMEQQLRHMFDGDDLVLTLTREDRPGYLKGRIDEGFLKKNVSGFSGYFYVCGPDEFVRSVSESLRSLGADTAKIVVEG